MKIHAFLPAVLFMTVLSCSPDLKDNDSALSYLCGYRFASGMILSEKDLPVVKNTVKTFLSDDCTAGPEPSALGKTVRSSLSFLRNCSLNIKQKAWILGIKDSAERNPCRLPDERIRELTEILNAKISSADFSAEQKLAELKNDREVKRTGTGLMYRILQTGSGIKPSADSRITARMNGSLLSGYILSAGTDLPQTFYIKALVPGLKEGFMLMNEGSRYIFYIPPELAYKDRPFGLIPADSYLVYEAELLKVINRKEADERKSVQPSERKKRK